MRIQHNILAMNAYRNYTNNTSALSKNLEKLSSGYKINRAGDDAAGLAISEKMRAQITGLSAAQKNAKDGISLVKTAEGALSEVHDMLNRMVSLATQSANGTYDNETDRLQLQKEISELKAEINRIADSSNFNGIKLLDGSMDSTAINGVSYNALSDADVLGLFDQTKGSTQADMIAGKTRYETEGGAQSTGQFEISLDGISLDLKAADTFTLSIGSATVTASLAAGKWSSTELAAALAQQGTVKMNCVNANGSTVAINFNIEADGQKLKFTVSNADKETEFSLITNAHVNWSLASDDPGEGGSYFPDDINFGFEYATSNPGTPVGAREVQKSFAQTIEITTKSGAAEYGVGTFAALANSSAAATITLASADKASAAKILTALKTLATASNTAVAFSLGTATGKKIDIKWQDIAAAIQGISSQASVGAIKTALANAINNAVAAKTESWGSTEAAASKAVYQVKASAISFATNAVKISGVEAATFEETKAAEAPSASIDFAGKTGKDVIGGTITIGSKTYQFVASAADAGSNVAVVVTASTTAANIAKALASAVTNSSNAALASSGGVSVTTTKITFTAASVGAELEVEAGGTVTVEETDPVEPTKPTITSGHAGVVTTVQFGGGKGYGDWASGDSITFDFTSGGTTKSVTFSYDGDRWTPSGDNDEMFDGYTLTFDGKYLKVQADASGAIETTDVPFTSVEVSAVTIGGDSSVSVGTPSGDIQVSMDNWALGDGGGPELEGTVSNQENVPASGIDFSDLSGSVAQSAVNTIASWTFTFKASGADTPLTINFGTDFTDALTQILDAKGGGTPTTSDVIAAMESVIKAAVAAWNSANGNTEGTYSNVRLHVGDGTNDDTYTSGDLSVANSGLYAWISADFTPASETNNPADRVINAGIQNPSDNVSGASAQLAHVTVDFFGKGNALQDGAQIRIGDTTYTLAIGENSKFKNVTNAVDLTDFDLKSSDPAKLKKVAAQRLAEAATGNSIFSVGHDGNGKITLAQRSTVKDSTDMSTAQRLAKYFGVSIADPDSVETAKAGSALTLQIGDTSDSYNQLNVSISDCHTTSLGIAGVDISTQEGAEAAISAIKNAINYVSDVRGTLGATQNRLEHTQNNLSVMAENIQDAESTIRDTDVAEEMMSYVKNNILIQSAQAMLAQANQIPQGVLQLLG